MSAHYRGRKRIGIFDPADFRRMRRDAGLSRRGLGGCAGVSSRTLAYWEDGQKQPSADAFRRALAAIFDRMERMP